MKLMIIGVTLAGFAAFTPLSAQRPSGNQRGSRQDCTNSQTANTVSDIIFGRSGNNNTRNCVDNRGNHVNGGWYQVGRDGNGGTIYERQTRDSNGNLIIQRARRDVYGNMTIISTRNAGNDGRYNDGTYNNGRRHGDGEEDDQGNYQNGRRHGDGDEDDQGNYQNDRRRGNDNQNGRGHGNKNKNKNKNHHDGD